MKIAFYALRDFDELPFCKKYSKEHGIDFVWTSEYPNENNLCLAEGCDGVSFTPCLITEEYLDKFASYGVKALLCRSIGFDHIPLQYAKKLGMHVCNTTYPTDCVADYAIMLMLMCLRKMQHVMERAAVQDFSLKGKMGRDIGKMTIGVLGTGNIGRTLMKHLSGFGCKLLAYDLYQNDETKKYAEYVDLDTIYKECDIITLHLPSNPGTFHMINEETLAKMKDGVVIINTARGNLIDSTAFIKAVKSGKVGAAGLDLLENENGLYYYNRMGDVIDNDELNTLRSFSNVIVSPHNAFYVESTVDNMIWKSFNSVHCYAKGEPNPAEVIIK